MAVVETDLPRHARGAAHGEARGGRAGSRPVPADGNTAAQPSTAPQRRRGPPADHPLLRRNAQAVIHGVDEAYRAKLSTPDPRNVSARISRTPPAPVVRPPSSREIARRKAKAEEQARNAEAARALAAQVQRGIRPPAGKGFSVDVGARLLIGPGGAVGTTERMARTLEPLAAGGRHAAAVLVAAGGWPSEAALREALAALGGKLAAIGLRADRRKAGIRIAKARPA